MRTLLLRISVVLAVLYLLTVSVEGPSLVLAWNGIAIDLFAISKVGSILMLLWFAARAVPTHPALIGGLAFSDIGDFLLAAKHIGPWDEPKLFIAGLIAFLLAHLCYITLFVNNADRKTSQLRRFTITVVIAALWFLLSRLWPTLGSMRIPVVAYSLALSTMATTAQLSRFPAVVSMGALSFFASDAMLAVSHFAHPFPASRPLIWITYYVAQFLISAGVINSLSSPSNQNVVYQAQTSGTPATRK